MTDPPDLDVRSGDLPVREIPNNIAMLDALPEAQALTREQRVASVYGAAIVRVLLEQSEHCEDLLLYLREEGSSFDLLREEALDRARVIAELFLSARREDVDIVEASVPGQEPLGALFALEAIKSCDVALTSEDPDPHLLLTPEELDLLVRNEHMEQWWENTLPRGETPPPRFGEGDPLPQPPPTDASDAERAVKALATCVRESVADYRALLADHARRAHDGTVREGAKARAIEITRLTQGNFRRDIDFGLLAPSLRPVAAGAVLKAIADSCVVLAAPAGDFDRYGITAGELDEALAQPDLRSWQDAVAEA